MGRAALREEQELDHSDRALARATADLDELAYAASHDLRAPLVALSQIMESLEQELEQSGSGSDAVRAHLGEVQRQLHRSDALLQGIGHFWRAGGSPSRHRIEATTLDALVHDACTELHVPPAAVVEAAPGAPPLRVDGASVTEALRELIANALRHGARDDVHVRVSARARPDGGWAFSVCDDGPGIPHAYRERVWRLFFTLKPRRGDAGPGVGLAMVRRLVELRGGEVWIADAPAGGACVGFTWPG
ncbi:MAG TPA: HAMP domain-containing sensor histidine kinase [Kofleriaceae bacterium]|nr:HAMP domain-containing sensor histidine kinase [Kofleriaceae bacterium]